jgi:hypothetical protein
MVKSPFVTRPASDGSPASLIKASYDYVESSLAHLLVRQILAGQATHLVIAVCFQEASHHGRSRVFDRHLMFVWCAISTAAACDTLVQSHACLGLLHSLARASHSPQPYEAASSRQY